MSNIFDLKKVFNITFEKTDEKQQEKINF